MNKTKHIAKLCNHIREIMEISSIYPYMELLSSSTDNFNSVIIIGD